MTNYNSHSVCLILCLGLMLVLATGCKHAENATSSFRLNENRASTLVYMAQMVGSCHRINRSDRLASQYRIQQNNIFSSYSDEQIANPSDELKQAIQDSIDTHTLYALQLFSSACNNSTCPDLGYIVMKYPAEFSLLNNILSQGEKYKDNDGVLATIAEEGEYKYEDYLTMLLDAYNLATTGAYIPQGIGSGDIKLPYTKYEFPADFGYSPWDALEFARTLVDLERVRCPIASEVFVTRYIKAIEKIESSLGTIPPKYATYANRLSYFEQFSFIKNNITFITINDLTSGIANIYLSPDMMTNSENISTLPTSQATLSRIIPGYNEIMFYGKLIASLYHFPEQFIIMHLQYPELVSEFYKHIRDHRPIYSYGVPNTDQINLFFANSYVPPEFGDNPMDIIMIAKYWMRTLPQDSKMPMNQVQKSIERVIRLRSSVYSLPQQYRSDGAMQQYFGQFQFNTNMAHH